jgi:hypothetical protein
MILPQSTEELDKFVKEAIQSQGLPEGKRTERTIYQLLWNLPHNQLEVTYEEIASGVRKAIAGSVILEKLNLVKAEMELEKKQVDTTTEGSTGEQPNNQNQEG